MPYSFMQCSVLVSVYDFCTRAFLFHFVFGKLASKISIAYLHKDEIGFIRFSTIPLNNQAEIDWHLGNQVSVGFY